MLLADRQSIERWTRKSSINISSIFLLANINYEQPIKTWCIDLFTTIATRVTENRILTDYLLVSGQYWPANNFIIMQEEFNKRIDYKNMQTINKTTTKCNVVTIGNPYVASFWCW